jgi:hypothetical protein
MNRCVGVVCASLIFPALKVDEHVLTRNAHTRRATLKGHRTDSEQPRDVAARRLCRSALLVSKFHCLLVRAVQRTRTHLASLVLPADVILLAGQLHSVFRSQSNAQNEEGVSFEPVRLFRSEIFDKTESYPSGVEDGACTNRQPGDISNSV